MSNIENLKRLRELTGAPVGDCKAALEETEQDPEAARLLLKERGLLVGVLRGAKDTTQGITIATTTKDTSKGTEVNSDTHYTCSEFGTITCLSCETDFVAKLDAFVDAAEEISLYSVENELITLEKLEEEFKDKLSEVMSTVKENVKLSYYTHMDGEHISIYNHHNKRLSVLVKFNKQYDEQIGKNVAMQIASMRPLFVDYDDIPQSVLDAEKESATKKTKEANPDKPDDLIEKISKGRLDKSMDEMTLLNQKYTQAEKKETVRQYLESIDKDLKVLAFTSFDMGDAPPKKKEDA